MISIILPSLRRRAVIRRIKEFSGDYEIIVVSPFIVKGAVHIYEPYPLGSIHAHNLAYRNCSGDYIMWWADDTSPTENCLENMVNFVKGKDLFIGSFRVKDRRGTELVQWSINGKLYACFGCVARETLDSIGGYFNPMYKSYWADPDMSLRVWGKGGRVEVCPDAWVITEGISDKISVENSKKYFQQDMETFVKRWGKADNKPIGEGKLYPQFSIPKTLLNKLLVFYGKIVPEGIRGMVRNGKIF